MSDAYASRAVTALQPGVADVVEVCVRAGDWADAVWIDVEFGQLRRQRVANDTSHVVRDEFALGAVDEAFLEAGVPHHQLVAVLQ